MLEFDTMVVLVGVGGGVMVLLSDCVLNSEELPLELWLKLPEIGAECDLVFVGVGGGVMVDDADLVLISDSENVARPVPDWVAAEAVLSTVLLPLSEVLCVVNCDSVLVSVTLS